MESNDLMFPVVPCPKPRMTKSDKYKSRPPVIRYRNFQNAICFCASEIGYKLGEELSLTFVMPMPTSYSEKKKNMLRGEKHQIKPDLDNLVKAFKDSLATDDSFVWRYNKIEKIWGDDGKIIIHNSQ